MTNEQHQDGFHGWVKWVVVLAALLTIADNVYEGVKGFSAGITSGLSAPAKQR